MPPLLKTKEFLKKQRYIKLSNSLKGHKLSDETKEKIRKSHQVVNEKLK